MPPVVAEPMTAKPMGRWADDARLARLADGLVVAVAVSLPWSTSATSILIVLWLVAVIPTLELAAVRREVVTLAGGLPVLLWLLGMLGMLWADATWAERLGGASSFHRLLAVPLLLAQFRRSRNGGRVLIGFLASAVALLIASTLHALLWGRVSWTPGYYAGIPVKDYISQSVIFSICMFALLGLAVAEWRAARRLQSIAAVVLAAMFLADIGYVATGRTTLVIIPVIAALFGLRHFGWKGMIGVMIAGAATAVLLWESSPYLRARVERVIEDVRLYEANQTMTSNGLRLEFWKKSMAFVGEAPLFGHGTGSINGLFRRSAVGQDQAAAVASENPHQQIFTIAIQVGLVGAGVLLAVWAAHLALFLGPGLAAWIGFVVVVQNIVSSCFNSHLFDFTHGWIYVFGVGVIGGMIRRQGAKPSAVPQRVPATIRAP
jgi:O-antigen ligase